MSGRAVPRRLFRTKRDHLAYIRHLKKGGDVELFFKSKIAAKTYQRKLEKAGRVATAPYKVKGGYLVRSTRFKVFLKPYAHPKKRARKKIKPNRGKRPTDKDMEELMRDPGFKKALKLYRKLHGCDPESISRVILPIGGKRVTGREFFASMGRAPAESYEPYQAGSRKKGKIWVHPYDNKPEKVVSADGRTIITLPGTHGVRDIDGEAWIDG